MTRVKVTYVAMDSDGNKPIVTASTFEELRKGLDDYYAVDRTDAICLGFTPYETKYPDSYEGHYGYAWSMITHGVKETLIDTIKVYCVDYYPHTVYDTTPITWEDIFNYIKTEIHEDIPHRVRYYLMNTLNDPSKKIKNDTERKS